MRDPKKLLRQAARPVLFLLTFIFICAFLAHYLSGSETLLEYARNNPEQAYGRQDEPVAEPPKNVEPETTLPSTVDENDDAFAQTNPDTSVTQDKAPAYTGTKGSIPDIPAETSAENTEDIAIEEEKSDIMEHYPDRTTYKEGFFYEPLSEAVKERITGISYPESGCTVPYEDLNYVGLKYIDFEGQEQSGELICNKAVAQDMTEIFYELYRNEYRLERVRLIDEYAGDDTASMADNNTSCFNYRVVDGTSNLSKHAYGLAIDINPYYNPYVVFHRNADGSDYISPPGSETYADRSRNFAYKIDENDLCYRLFTEHGFTWGGNWNSTKDYQHFQKTID